MVKKRIITVFVLIIMLLSILIAYRYIQYILVWQANQKIDVGGIRLMMSENEVSNLLGKEVYVQGFGGYRLEYPSKSIFLTFLDDNDTDFYHKVSQIEIADSRYNIYNVKVGDDIQKANSTIQKAGFLKQKEGFPGYWKLNMYIVLDYDNNKVQKITIGVSDRVSSSRIY